jgi:hypothetical protein
MEILDQFNYSPNLFPRARRIKGLLGKFVSHCALDPTPNHSTHFKHPLDEPLEQVIDFPMGEVIELRPDVGDDAA